MSRFGAVLPVGKIAGTELAVSYSILFALAGVAGAAALLAQQEGNGDLIRSAMVGGVVWVSGLVIQLAVAMAMAAFSGLRIRGCVVGLVGLELPAHRWNPDRAALLCVVVLQVLFAMGVMMWIIGLASVPDGSTAAVAATDLRLDQPPALGMKGSDAPWHAAAWLIWFQAICQVVPMPRTLGRVALLSMISLTHRAETIDPKVIFAKRFLQVAGVLLAIGALVWLLLPSEIGLLTAFLVAFVGGLIWVSASHRDIPFWLDSLAMVNDRGFVSDTCPTLREEIRRWHHARHGMRRIKEAQEREQSEAVDVSRLDDILQRLHEDGMDSLSDEEKAVLRRVSETLRERRNAQGEFEST